MIVGQIISNCFYTLFHCVVIHRLQMNQTEISGLEFTGLHDTHVGEESYATEFPEMNQDLSHKTEFDVVMATTAMHSGSGNSYACLDGYEDTRMMSGIQAVKEVRHGSTQHLEVQPDIDTVNICLLMQLFIPFPCINLFWFLVWVDIREHILIPMKKTCHLVLELHPPLITVYPVKWSTHSQCSCFFYGSLLIFFCAISENLENMYNALGEMVCILLAL